MEYDKIVVTIKRHPGRPGETMASVEVLRPDDPHLYLEASREFWMTPEQDNYERAVAWCTELLEYLTGGAKEQT